MYSVIFVMVLYYEPKYYTVNYRSKTFQAIIQPEKLYHEHNWKSIHI